MIPIKLTLFILVLPRLISNRFVKSFKSLDDHIQQVVTCHGLSGLSLTVVQDGKTLIHQGYGFADHASKTPVTHDTLYAVGSLSKQFTSLLLEYYQQEGWVDLSEPLAPQLRRVNKTFNITINGSENEEISLEDMLSHRTGLPGYPGLEFLANYSREVLLNRLFYPEKDTKPFRHSWEYNNWLYAAAARAGEILSGSSYEEDLKTLIFDNLGMKNSGTLSDNQFVVDNLENIAKPYFFDRGQNHLISDQLWLRGWNAGMTPAGGLLVSGRDMARWMKFLLSGGRDTTKHRFVKPETIADMFRTLNNMTTLSELFEGWSSKCYGYGLGWFLFEYMLGNGGVEYGHSGNLYDVHNSKISLYPDSKTGVFFAFSGGNSAYNRGLVAALDIIISEFMFNGHLHATKWNQINNMLHYHWGCFEEAAAQNHANSVHSKVGGVFHHETDSTISDSTYNRVSTLPDRYLGTYQHPFLGTAQLKRLNGEVSLVLNDLWTSKVYQEENSEENTVQLRCYFRSIPWIPLTHKDDHHNKMTVHLRCPDSQGSNATSLVIVNWADNSLNSIIYTRI